MSKNIPALGDMNPAKALEMMNEVRIKRALARRSFLRNVGLAGAGMVAGAVLEGCSSSTHAQSSVMPSDVLNFALNLEYLEAEFYSVATTGQTLRSSVTGGTSTVASSPSNAAVPFVTQEIQDMANEIASDEMLHVQFLRNALGTAAVAEPAKSEPAAEVAPTEPATPAVPAPAEPTVSADPPAKAAGPDMPSAQPPTQTLPVQPATADASASVEPALTSARFAGGSGGRRGEWRGVRRDDRCQRSRVV